MVGRGALEMNGACPSEIWGKDFECDILIKNGIYLSSVRDAIRGGL